MTPYVLAVDIGNTNTHIGLIKCASRSILSLDILPTGAIDANLVTAVCSAATSIQQTIPIPVVLCSVIQSAQQQFNNELTDALQAPVVWLGNNNKLPLHISYENPDALGADRIADMIYAHCTYPGENVIIVDAGTTITIDYLHHGNTFRGGAILPGPSTQLKSLHAHTDQLPELDISNPDNEFPGLSTAACIHAGVRYGTAGAVSFIVDRYRLLDSNPCRVIATGGAWPYLKHTVSFEARHIPEMTMAGCALYYTLLHP
jgi:pantothenate kinase type III